MIELQKFEELPQSLKALGSIAPAQRSRSYWVCESSQGHFIGLVFATPLTEEVRKYHRREFIGYLPANLSSRELTLVLESYTSSMDPEDLAVAKSFSVELSDSEEVIPGYRSRFSSRKSYYSYRISSPNSPKYYIGVRSITLPAAQEEDCLRDSYRGSGGKKFQNWMNVYGETTEKEILGIFSRSYLAFEHEEELVGDLWKTDPNCLNSTPGGKRTAGPLPTIAENFCAVHGLVAHLGTKCYHCRESPYLDSQCQIHGLVLHYKRKSGIHLCLRCHGESVVELRRCYIHGLVKHRGKSCYNCSNSKSNELKLCSIHGLVSHRGNSCALCKGSRGLSLDQCEIHGESQHWWGKCTICHSRSAVTLATCARHGLTKHRGKSCYKCSGAKTKHFRHLNRGEKEMEGCELCIQFDSAVR